MKAQFLRLNSLLPHVWLSLLAGAVASVSAANTDALTQAQRAVDRATQADADQYASAMIAQARQRLQQAQQASLDRHQRKQAPLLALQAAADADLATAQSQHAVVLTQLTQAKKDLNQLQREHDAAAPPLSAPAQATEPAVNSAPSNEAPTL